MGREKWINWLLFLVLSLIWGSSFILMKESSVDLNGWQIGSIRIVSAGLLFLPFALFHVKDIPSSKLLLVLLSGFLGNLFPAFLFAIAIEKKINSSMAAILNSLTPLLVILIALLFFKAKIERKKLIGVSVGFAGLLILTLSKGGITIDNYPFTLLVLLATFFYGLNVNIVSRHLKGVDPFKMATVSLAFMALFAGAVLWQQEVISIIRYDVAARKAVVYAVLLGVVGSAIATVMFYMLIKRAGGIFASLVTYGIPVVGIMWGLLFGEEITAIQIGCLAIILSGVYLANRT
ncbi:MAG TPA: DMT family transporter [Flavisolibacter sp.]|nr:DMT family transporter [Flavisolibacter sp.]